MRPTHLGAVTLVIALASLSSVSVARSDETPGEKVENKVGDVKTDVKKADRKVKRKHRKAVGKDNIAKDAGDKAKDAGDDISNTADKAKRKVE